MHKEEFCFYLMVQHMDHRQSYGNQERILHINKLLLELLLLLSRGKSVLPRGMWLSGTGKTKNHAHFSTILSWLPEVQNEFSCLLSFSAALQFVLPFPHEHKFWCWHLQSYISFYATCSILLCRSVWLGTWCACHFESGKLQSRATSRWGQV